MANSRTKARAKSQETRNNIIAVAIGLFRAKGYARTSMSEIARQAGVDPSSFYYYFASKEALIESILNPNECIPTAKDLEAHSSNRAAQLYALIAFDVVHKCELPFDFWELETIANDNPSGFEAFFDRYRKLYRTLITIIERGIEEGTFFRASRRRADRRYLVHQRRLTAPLPRKAPQGADLGSIRVFGSRLHAGAHRFHDRRVYFALPDEKPFRA